MEAYISTTTEYIIHYVDNSIARIPINAHYEITDGINGENPNYCSMGTPEAKVAFIYHGLAESKSGLYSYRWINSNPEKVITSIDISTLVNAGDAVTAVLAITGES